jgi:hypothetical protein
MPLSTIFQLFMVVISITGGGYWVPGENHWPATSHRQTISHKAALTAPYQGQDWNSQL